MSDYKHVVIDEQKNIILPEELKNHMVQYDHNVKTITFDCPRYSDGRDLSTMRIYVNYFRKSGEKDADRCENITVDSKDNNLIHFEWVPKRSATLEAGVLAFLICAEKEDTGGNQENAWHTKLCKDLKIAEGIDCLKAVIEKYPTIITYLLTRIEDVESIATPEAMQAYVNQYLLDYPPSGMTEEERALLEENFALTEQIQMDLATTTQSKADAIICEAEGTTIVATDSSDAGFEGLSLYGKSKQGSTTGKNLLENNATSKTENGLTFTINEDKSVTVNGTATAVTDFYIKFRSLWEYDSGQYILNGSSVTSQTGIYLLINSDGDHYSDTGKGTSEVPITNGKPYYVFIRLEAGTTVSNLVFKPMLRLASIEDDTYEPYTGGKPSPNPEYKQEVVSVGDGGSVEGKVCGAQLLNATKGRTETRNGITSIINDDGSITLNGTATSNVDFYFLTNARNEYVGKSAVISGSCLSQRVRVTLYQKYADGSTKYFSDEVDGGQLVLDGTVFGGFVRVNSGVTVSNLTIYPMLNVGSEPLPWEPYKEQTLTIQTPNGLPAIPLGTTIPDVIKNSPAHMSGVYWDNEKGQYYIADTVDAEKGVRVQRILYDNVCAGNVSISGDSNWYDSEKSYSYEIKYYKNGGNTFISEVIGLCTHFKAYTFIDFYYKSIESGIMNNQPYVVVNIPKELGICTTVDEFKTWCMENDVKIAKVLATPIETPLTDEEIAAYKALHTNKPTTTIMNSENVHMKVKYVADTKNHIKQNYIPLSKYTALEERVAAIEELVIS